MFGERRRQKKLMHEAGAYLRATDAVSRPVAILMTVIGFLIVATLFSGIIVGARWVYRQITNNNEPTTSTTSSSGTEPVVPGITAVPEDTSRNTTNTPNTQDAQLPETTPNTGPGPEVIPNTGPSDETEQ